MRWYDSQLNSRRRQEAVDAARRRSPREPDPVQPPDPDRRTFFLDGEGSVSPRERMLRFHRL